MISITAGTILLIAGLAIYRLLQVGKRDKRMPPGPPTLPIIGNFHQIPITGLYKHFGVWAKEYGSVFSLMFGPMNVVVLCDRKAIHSLLDKKGNIYSDRPDVYVANILTQGDHVSLSQMNSQWREKRKVLSLNFSPKNLDEKHFHVLEAEATALMNDLLDRPEGFYQHVKRYTASVASILTYGQRGPTFESFWGHAVYDVTEGWNRAMEPRLTPPVDVYPFLRLAPTFMSAWKKRAYDAKEIKDATWRKARAFVEKRRASGIHRDCVADTLLDEWEKKESWPMTHHGFNNLLGEQLEGAADTTAAQILTLILAWARNPLVQKKAQAEIDKVCGASRSPLWSDFEDIPYINAVVKEGMRWRPVAAMGLPHRVREDDEYEGMLIPKGSTIFVPVWALHHMDTVFEDDESFIPDRYLNHPKLASDYAGSPDWEHRDHYSYGAGRRVCPGMHLAERTMWRVTAKLLWAFEFSEPKDEEGNTVSLDPDAYKTGISQAPLPFEVDVKVRSQEHIETIRKEMSDAKDLLAAYE